MKEKKKLRKLRATYEEIEKMFPIHGYGASFYSRDEEACHPTQNGWWDVVESPLGPGAPFRRHREALPLPGAIEK